MSDALTVFRYIRTHKELIRDVFARAYMTEGRIRIGGHPAERNAVFLELLGDGKELKSALRCTLDLAQGTVRYGGRTVYADKLLHIPLPEAITDSALSLLLHTLGLLL